jgi:hypothetical protein
VHCEGLDAAALRIATRPVCSQLHEENELVWNDGVAPETALDFDVPHYSKSTGLFMWLGAFFFLYLNYKALSRIDFNDYRKAVSPFPPEPSLLVATLGVRRLLESSPSRPGLPWETVSSRTLNCNPSSVHSERRSLFVRV